jgi:ribulose-5-phosphate 4-epimerase/fuculose-1-phosphate aldolase
MQKAGSCAQSSFARGTFALPPDALGGIIARLLDIHHGAILMLANDPVTQARLDLTTALRTAARQGLNEGVCNHFSMTVPGRGDLFLVNPQGLHWSEITPSDLVIADGDGNIIEGKYPVEPTAFHIHARIHGGNSGAVVVLHTHMPYATALTSIRDGRLEMCTQNAFRYWGRIAYDDAYNGVALSADEGDRMCGAMAGKDILFLRNHGVIVSGPTVAQAYDDLYYLERAAMVQVLAMQTGRPLLTIDDALAEHTAKQMAGESQQALLHFESLKRMLDRDEPGWSRLAA